MPNFVYRSTGGQNAINTGGRNAIRSIISGGGGGSFVFNNEPVGYTLIQDFGMDNYPVWPALYQSWFDNGIDPGSMTVITDATAPQPSGVTDNKYIHSLFPPSQPAGTSPYSMQRPFSAGEQFNKLFIGMWCKHETGWENDIGGSGVKFWWFSPDDPFGSQFYSSHTSTNMDFEIIQQGTVDREMSANLDATAARIVGRVGQWVKYEFLFQLNTANGTANGLADVWIDDVHTHHYTDINYQSAAGQKWLAIRWEPTYGGGGSSPSKNIYQDISHVRISGHA